MRYSTTLILAAAVLLAALAAYLLRDRLAGERPAVEPAARPLVENLDVADVSRATLEERRDGQLATKAVFVKTDGRWRLAEPVACDADSYEVERLLRNALASEVRQTFEPGTEGQPRLADLDLEPPAFRLTLLADKTHRRPERTVVVDIGRRSALGEGAYVRLADEKQVAVLQNADLLACAREKVDTFRSRQVAVPPRDQIVRITLESPEGTVRLDRSGEDASRWVLAEPLAARADRETCNAILRQVTGLRVREFVADGAEDLARFGLEPPRLTVTLFKKTPEPPAEKPTAPEGAEAEEKPEPPAAKPESEPTVAQRLRFGAWADLKKQTVYLATDPAETGTVVAVDASVLEPLEKNADALRDRRALALDRNRVEHVEVESAQGRFELHKAGGGAWRLSVPDRPDADADPGAVAQFLSDAEELKVLYFLPEEEQQREFPEGLKPQGRLRLHLEGEAAPRGLDVGGTAESRTLLANIRETWIARAAESDIAFFQKPWVKYLDRPLLAFAPREAVGLTIRTSDRTVRLERADDGWKMVEPVEADADPAFTDLLMETLQDLRVDAWVDATENFKPHGLDTGDVVCTVALAPKAEDAPPEEKILHLALKDDGTCLARLEGRDLVAQIPSHIFFDVAAEPLPRLLTEFQPADVQALQVIAGDSRLRLRKDGQDWVRLDEAGNPAGTVQAGAADLASAVARLTVARWAAYDAKNLAQFGLETPAFRILVTTAAGETAIRISEKQVPDKVAELIREKPVRYALVEGPDKVGIAILGGPTLQSLLDAPKSLKP